MNGKELIASLSNWFQKSRKMPIGSQLGLVAGGLMWLGVQCYYPDLPLSRFESLLIGMSGGAGLGALLQRFYLSSIRPIQGTVRYYFKHIELWGHEKLGIISKKELNAYRKEICKNYFLPTKAPLSTSNQLEQENS